MGALLSASTHSFIPFLTINPRITRSRDISSALPNQNPVKATTAFLNAIAQGDHLKSQSYFTFQIWSRNFKHMHSQAATTIRTLTWSLKGCTKKKLFNDKSTMINNKTSQGDEVQLAHYLTLILRFKMYLL